MPVPVDRMTEAIDRMQKAGRLGMVLTFDSGLILMRDADPEGVDVREAMIKRLLPYLPEIRLILEKRARVERAKGLVGAQLFLEEYAEPGKLMDVSDALLIAEIHLGFVANASRIAVDPAKIIILTPGETGVETRTASSSAQQNDDQKIEREKLGRKGLAELLGFMGGKGN